MRNCEENKIQSKQPTYTNGEMIEQKRKHVSPISIIVFTLIMFISAACFNSEPQKEIPNTDSYSGDNKNAVSRQEIFNDHIDTQRSSWIDELQYSEDLNGYSIVKMRANGHQYTYYQVPRELWNEWKDAPSLGRFYNKHIKGNYSTK